MAFGFALMGLAAWFFLRGLPLSPLPEKGETPQPAQAQSATGAPSGPQLAAMVPEGTGPSLQSELEQVMTEVRDANQKKDLSQLLSHYSPNFPQLTQRAQGISKAWKIYDYPEITFEVKEARLLPDKTAEAKVIWEAEAQNISTRKSSKVTKTYVIKFVKESGQWRIKALNEVK